MAQVMPATASAMTQMTVQVPEGAPPGTMVQLTAPNGQPVQVQIPPGLGPGQQFTIAVPAAAPQQMMMPAAPAGPVVLVDHLLLLTCGKMPGQAFAGYAADDVMGAGARPAFASEVTFGMLMDNMGCCKNPYQGLEVPVYLSTIDPGTVRSRTETSKRPDFISTSSPRVSAPATTHPSRGGSSRPASRIQSFPTAARAPAPSASLTPT
jgi:hypothetical protein